MEMKSFYLLVAQLGLSTLRNTVFAGLVLGGFWLMVWALIHCVRSRQLSAGAKVGWIGLMLLLPILGAALYAFLQSNAPKMRLAAIAVMVCGVIAAFSGKVVDNGVLRATAQPFVKQKLLSARLDGVTPSQREEVLADLNTLETAAGPASLTLSVSSKRYRDLAYVLHSYAEDGDFNSTEYNAWKKFYSLGDGLSDSKEFNETLAYLEYVQSLTSQASMNRSNKSDQATIALYQSSKQRLRMEDPWTQMQRERFLWEVAQAYMALNDKEKEASVRVDLARIRLKRNGPMDSFIDSYLSGVEMLDPKSEDLKAVRREIDAAMTAGQREVVKIQASHDQHQWDAVITHFQTYEPMLCAADPVARDTCLRVLPLLAEAYRMKGQYKQASYYYTTAARIALELGRPKEGIQILLNGAESWDPQNPAIARLRAELKLPVSQ